LGTNPGGINIMDYKELYETTKSYIERRMKYCEDNEFTMGQIYHTLQTLLNYMNMNERASEMTEESNKLIRTIKNGTNE